MHKDFFECYVGYNLASAECSPFVQRHQRFGTDQHLDADTSDCDSTNDAHTLVALKLMFIRLARAAGYSQVDVRRVALLVASLGTAAVYYKGDVFVTSEHNWSGVLLTLITNVLFLRIQYTIAWLAYLKEHLPRQYEEALRGELRFRHMNVLSLLGDDTVLSPSPLLREFDFAFLKANLATRNIRLTPGDKGDSERGFKSIHAISSLKRRFAQDVDLGQWVPRLELVSILRSLAWRGASALGDKDHAAACMRSASLEFFLYGRAVYGARSRQLARLALEHGIDFVPAEYEEVRASFGGKQFRVW